MRAAYRGMRLLNLLVLSILSVLSLSGQPTGDMFGRVMMIESKHGRGTTFSIDIESREYWVTARHILTGNKNRPYGTVTDKVLELKILNPGGSGQEWIPTKFIILQPSSDVDIAVLVPPALIVASARKGPLASSDGLILGGNCEFLGFPYGGGWRAKFPGGIYWLPYVKHCSVSGMEHESGLWILDGINNSGFSGGP